MHLNAIFLVNAYIHTTNRNAPASFLTSVCCGSTLSYVIYAYHIFLQQNIQGNGEEAAFLDIRYDL